MLRRKSRVKSQIATRSIITTSFTFMEQSFIYGLGNLENQMSVFTKIKDNGLKNIQFLKNHLNKPEYNKPKKSFSISDVERLLGISRSSIRDKEKAGKISYADETDLANKTAYTLDDLNKIRDFFKKGFFNGSVSRPTHLQPLALAFSMFKGGVGKTTQATHLAAHCAIQGLKTLLVDLDPQASATFVYGYLPSVDIQSGNTIFSSLLDDPNHIKSIIKPTHYDGLHIITSGLELQSADIVLPNNNLNNSEEMGPPLLRLYNALRTIKNDYDIIIFDCAPNHAATTMNALAAADGFILPVTPNMLSYGSSIQFTQTLVELTWALTNYRDNVDHKSDNLSIHDMLSNYSNKLFRVLITDDPSDIEAQDATDAIRNLFGSYVLPRPMSRTIALTRSSNDMSLLYDLRRQEVRGSKESFDRGLASMKAVNDDILINIRSIWGLDNE